MNPNVKPVALTAIPEPTASDKAEFICHLPADEALRPTKLRSRWSRLSAWLRYCFTS